MSEAKAAARLECAGRFCLQVPAGFTRKGDSFKFGLVTLEEAPLPVAGEKGFQALWAARLSAIAALRDPSSKPDDPTGQVAWRGTLGPRFEAAMPEDGMLAGLLEREGSALSFQRFLNFGKKDLVLERFTDIAKAWRPRKAGEPWPVSGLPAFYLRSSVIAEPAYGGEEAYVRFEEEGTHAKLVLTTQDVVEPETRGLLARLGEATTRAGLSLAGAFSVVRSGGRKAGGEKGDELILKVEGGKELSFAWTFPGGKDDPDRPEIVIKLETSSENQKEKLAAWDRLLDSLRRADRP